MENAWIPAIRRLMSEKGWSQSDLAKRSGIRPNTISDVLNGADCRIGTLQALAKAFDTPIWGLFVDSREAALFSEQIKKMDVDAAKAAEREEIRAMIRAEFTALVAPMEEALLAKLTGQPVAPAANPLPTSTSVAPSAPGRKHRKHGR